MKYLLYSVIITAFLLLEGNSVLKAQTASVAMTYPVILKYYTPEQLEYLEQKDTTELASIIYFFTKSFIVTPIDCYDCLPFDSTNFDIMKYEYLRLPDQTYSRTFDKYGFKLILFSVNQLPYYYETEHVPHTDPGENNQHQ